MMGRLATQERLVRWLAGAIAALAAIGAIAQGRSPPSSAAGPAPTTAENSLQCAVHFRAILASQPWPLPVAHLRTARCLVRTGDTAGALAEVRNAIDHPSFREHDDLVADSGLIPLRQSPEWPKLVELAASKSALPEPMGSGVDIHYMRSHLPQIPSGILRKAGSISVVLIVWVAADATPARVDVEKSSGIPEIDAIAVAAARTWRYLPANANGETFGYPTRIPLAFSP